MNKIIVTLCLYISIMDAIVSIETDKVNYLQGEPISITFSGMSGTAQDWIGIYPKDSDLNVWANVKKWDDLNGLVEGTTILDNNDLFIGELPLGEYAVHLFKNNSSISEANTTIYVTDVRVETDKQSYVKGEPITVNFTGMSGAIQDWVGVYPQDSDISLWSNVMKWDYLNGNVSGSTVLDSNDLIVGNLPVGDYEIHAFNNNSFISESSYYFDITPSYPLAGIMTAIPTNTSTPYPSYYPTTQISVTGLEFNNKISRITDNANTTPERIILGPTYPRRQAWNNNMTMLRLGYRILDAKTYEEMNLTASKNTNNELYALFHGLDEARFRWSSNKPNVFYGVDSGNEFVHGTITGNVITYANNNKALFNDYISVKMGPGEGNIDVHDHYVALAALDNNNVFSVLIYNIETDSIDLKQEFPNINWNGENNSNDDLDWISISPNGSFVLISTEDNFLKQYYIDFANNELSYIRTLTASAEHGDLGENANYEDVYVQFLGANGEDGIYSYNLDTGAVTQLLPQRYGMGHISCRNQDRLGWCYVSAKEENYLEVFAVKLDGSGTVERFAQTHQVPGTYSHAVASPDGSKVLFYNTIWDGQSSNEFFVTEAW